MPNGVKMNAFVSVREVGPRDGLQLVKTHLDTATKIAWIKAQAQAGFREIEVTSFVPPSVLPQFSDAAEVLAAANAMPDLKASVLVPNLKGGIRALEAGARKVTFVLSASESHNQSNVRCSTDASLDMFRELKRVAGEVEVAGVIATSFGCSIEGHVSEKRVIDIARQLVDAGADEISLADTVGYANPRQVRELFSYAIAERSMVPLAAHFHDTRGFGIANVMAAFDKGVRRFDAALGGLGGCPFAPGASGNVATEDVVHLLTNVGADTGIDMKAIIKLRERLSAWLPDEKLYGKLLAAGLGAA